MPANDQKIDPDRFQLSPRVLIFAAREEKILLIKGSPQKKLWPNLYNGVGGHIESGETPLTAAKREFLEETGLQLQQTQICAVITIDIGQNTGIILFVFKGTTRNEELTPSEEGTLEWIDINKINDLPTVEDLKLIIPKIWGGQDTIIFAQYSYEKNGKLLIAVDE